MSFSALSDVAIARQSFSGVRHRLVVDVLCALGVPTESTEADAEGIKHYVSEVTLKAFAHFLKSWE